MFYSLKTTSAYVNNLKAEHARTGNRWRRPIGHCRNYPVKLPIADHWRHWSCTGMIKSWKISLFLVENELIEFPH
jgi:hypothetical protein